MISVKFSLMGYANKVYHIILFEPVIMAFISMVTVI